MATPRDPSARRYYRVAYQRLEDALILLRMDRLQAAIYLAGYAVECILKALILSQTPATRRRQVLASFRGAIAHNITWLRERLDAALGRLPVEVARQLSFVSGWSTDLRYEPGAGNPEDAREFLQAAQHVLNWADGRM